MSHEFPESQKKIMRARSESVCEGCGLLPAAEFHHRQYRSRGGQSIASNGLHLCGWGNHTGCHGIAHTGKGEELGWSVRSGHNPALVPVFHKFDSSWWRQHTDAPAELLHPLDAVEYMTLIGAIRERLAI
jgi:hypothetical protein